MNFNVLYYLEKVNGYTVIHHVNNEQDVIDISLKQILEASTNSPLFRANKSIIINLRKVVEVCPMESGANVKLENGFEVLVSKRRKKELMKRLLGPNE